MNRFPRAWVYVSQGFITGWCMVRGGFADGVSVLLTNKPAGVPQRAE